MGPADGEQDWQPVARLEDLPSDGSGLSLAVGPHQVALFHHRGELFALDDSCPHMGGSLGLGVAIDGEVACPWHSFHFCLRTGKNTDGLDERVRVWAVRLAPDGRVEVARALRTDRAKGQ